MKKRRAKRPFPAEYLSVRCACWALSCNASKRAPLRVWMRAALIFQRQCRSMATKRSSPFSFYERKDRARAGALLPDLYQRKTHEIIRENIHRSPLYSGMIKGIGRDIARQSKIRLLSSRIRTGIRCFLEPEGLHTNRYMCRGNVLQPPVEVQVALYRTVAGMEHVHFVRPAYAIEYDCIDPTRLMPSLQTKTVPGLFTAGQINGTSGYEEAGVQGLVAGLMPAGSLMGKNRRF